MGVNFIKINVWCCQSCENSFDAEKLGHWKGGWMDVWKGGWMDVWKGGYLGRWVVQLG